MNMNRREFVKASAAVTGIALLAGSPSKALAEEPKPIQLSKPDPGTAKPLLQTLWKRQSMRQFTSEQLPIEVLSNLLWAAWGINRSDGRRTAPSASNRQEVDIYVAMASGLYVYDPKMNSLNPILGDDIRERTGVATQAWVKDAAVNLVYVADYSRFGALKDQAKDFYAAADTGLIGANVYLFCASEGLATVIRAAIDRPALARAMRLRPDQQIVLAQSVGYPKKA